MALAIFTISCSRMPYGQTSKSERVPASGPPGYEITRSTDGTVTVKFDETPPSFLIYVQNVGAISANRRFTDYIDLGQSGKIKIKKVQVCSDNKFGVGKFGVHNGSVLLEGRGMPCVFLDFEKNVYPLNLTTPNGSDPLNLKIKQIQFGSTKNLDDIQIDTFSN
jgi:hypothetical protein